MLLPLTKTNIQESIQLLQAVPSSVSLTFCGTGTNSITIIKAVLKEATKFTHLLQKVISIQHLAKEATASFVALSCYSAYNSKRLKRGLYFFLNC